MLINKDNNKKRREIILLSGCSPPHIERHAEKIDLVILGSIG